jgi:hypothetical protein
MSEHFFGSNKGFEILVIFGENPLISDERRREAEATGRRSGNRVSYLLIFGLHAGELLRLGRTIGKEPLVFCRNHVPFAGIPFFGPLEKKEYGKEFLFLAGFLEEFPRIPGTGISNKGIQKRNAQPSPKQRRCRRRILHRRNLCCCRRSETGRPPPCPPLGITSALTTTLATTTTTATAITTALATALATDTATAMRKMKIMMDHGINSI